MPVLEDLYNLLRAQDEKEAQYIATALEIYVTGSLNVFNHRSNVDINNRIVCYDIKELGKQLKKIGMLIVQDAVWNRVTVNREAHKSTRYYIDEMHLLLKEEQTAAYTVEIWKRFRKWGGIPTGLTQNVKDLLSSREVENIFENRYRHVDELARMGAEVRVAGRVAVVTGREHLHGARVKCTDLRAGAALVIAGLQADGLTRISRIEHIDRGYESIERDLGVLGAHVRRETGT